MCVSVCGSVCVCAELAAVSGGMRWAQALVLVVRSDDHNDDDAGVGTLYHTYTTLTITMMTTPVSARSTTRTQLWNSLQRAHAHGFFLFFFPTSGAAALGTWSARAWRVYSPTL